ncbi:MAG: tripartite tricarboxylate transporter substrate binding protein [Burkholderiales bacterium]
MHARIIPATLIPPVIALIAALGACFPVHGQDYPAKQIRIIVPTTAASLTDLVARLFAQRLSATSKQAAIVENRPGGGGTIGGDLAAKSAPDGYTLLMGFHGLNAILPALGAKMPFDPAKDLTPVILLLTVPNLLVINPSVPATSVSGLIALAKEKPGSLTYASQGIGSSGHLAGELFRNIAALDIVHVPYKGPAEAVRDLISGEISMMFDVVMLALPNVKAGKVRALAVATRERVSAMPDLPTMAELGLPGVEGGAWFAVFAPAGTPRPVIDWLNREARIAFSEPEVRSRFVTQGAALPLGSPEDLAAYVAAQRERWAQVGRTANIRLD